MIKDYILMAFSNLRHRGLRSWLTLIGIIIGIAAVVALISLGQGLREAVTGQFASLSTDTLVVQSAETGFGPPGSTAVRDLTENDLDIIKSAAGVEMAVPRLLRSTKLEYNDLIAFRYITTLTEDQEEMDYVYGTIDAKVSQGRLLKPGDSRKLLIGADFMKKEHFGKEVRVGTRILLQDTSFEVVGILERSGTLQINNAAFTIEEDLKDILEIGDEIDLIAVKVISEERVEETAELIKKKLRRDRDQKEGEEDFSVQTPIQALSSVNDILNIINLIVIGIAIVSLFVGGVGIANTMYTSVLERYREIGVMKAVGARNSDILRVFLIESGLLGLVGGILGALIGMGFAFAIAFIANTALGQELLIIVISWPLVTLAITFSFLIGLISGVSPALQASQLKPVQALRA